MKLNMKSKIMKTLYGVYDTDSITWEVSLLKFYCECTKKSD